MSTGDVVKLNSGGPPMVVTRVTEDACSVSWIHNGNEIKNAVFPTACLTKITREVFA